MSAEDFRLLVGLGNPGNKYKHTRHNIGFMALEKLANQEGVAFRERKKLHGYLAEITLGTGVLRLLMPNTFMNDSGRAIRATLDWFDLEISQLLILVDDIDLPLGRLRLRKQGSSGGHNGLRSTIQHLGTENFSRLRIGIGAPATLASERKRLTVSHVLGNFTAKEELLVDKVTNEVLHSLESIQRLGIEKASNSINSFKPEDL